MKRRKRYPFTVLLLLLSLLLDSTPASATTPKKETNYVKYSLNISTSNLLLDESFTLSVDGITDEEVSFRSEDTSIVSISETDINTSCECNGESVGTTSIIVKIKEKGFLFFTNTTKTLTCKVTVSPKANSIKFAKKSIKLPVGSRKKLKVICRPSITTEIPVLTSSNPAVVSINSAGKVVARSKGTATITAAISNKSTSTCKIIVTKK